MRTAKAAGRAMTKQDEEKLQAGEEKWEKYKKAYGKMRTALDGPVTGQHKYSSECAHALTRLVSCVLLSFSVE